MKNTVEAMNSSLGDTEKCVNNLEDRIMKAIQSE